MTKSNSSAHQNTSNLYEHPWYTQLHLLGSTITSESQSQQKLKSEPPGRKYTECQHCGAETRPPLWQDNFQRWRHFTVCHPCDQFWTKYRFRLTKEDRAFLNEKPYCQICGTKEDLVIDHCHATNKVRGYLCSSHNKGVGIFNDDISLLEATIKYLQTNGS